MRRWLLSLVVTVGAASCLLDRAGTVDGNEGGAGGAGATGGMLTITVGPTPAAGPAAGPGGAAGQGGLDTGGQGGMGGDPCPPAVGNVDYEIRTVPGAAITIDGECDESAWPQVEMLPLMADSNFKDSDNEGWCRLLWQQGDPPIVYGCCEINDTQLEASVTNNDGNNIWNDDGIEYFLKGNLNDERDLQTVKIFANILGTVRDEGYDVAGMAVVSDDVNVSATATTEGSVNNNGGGDDVRYTLEWSHEVPFTVTPNLEGRCEFNINDGDQNNRLQWRAFSMLDESINEPSFWGTCRFACEPTMQ